ncbi:MAG: hypothetical protein J6A01_05245 [Proteobacteria bacterium]|nr:hypothetical protein [Pseudomonadota bacterium]
MNRFKICMTLLVVLGVWGCASNDAFDPGSVCPENPLNKTVPGTCGCFIADVDEDNNGVMDCLETSSKPEPEPVETDQCPDDENKTSEGMCGCGVSDDDSDNDTVPDCFDRCKDDAEKLDLGVCGCGTPDVDTNNNGIIDCNEHCEPRCEGDVFYGCDGDLYIDSEDCSIIDMVCIQDEEFSGCVQGKCRYKGELLDEDAKVCEDDVLLVCTSGRMEPTECEVEGYVCRIVDSEADCRDPNEDLCPDDPEKTDPGECGCNVSEEDSNNNDIKDCKENCTPACTGNVLTVCNDKLFGDPIDCSASNKVCGKNASDAFDCVDPDLRCAFQEEMLEPGTKRCGADGSLLTCTNSQMVASACPANQICDAGECRNPHECMAVGHPITHANNICYNSELILSCNDGTVVVKESCGSDSEENMKSCILKETGPECVALDETTVFCEDPYGEYVAQGVQICSDDATEILICDEEGMLNSVAEDKQCTEEQFCVIENNKPKCVDKPLIFDSIVSLRAAVGKLIDGGTCATTLANTKEAQVNVVGHVTAIDDTKGFYIQDVEAHVAVYVASSLPTGIAVNDKVKVESDAAGSVYCKLQIMGNVNVTKIESSDPVVVEPLVIQISDLAGAVFDNMFNSVLIQIKDAETDAQFSTTDDPIKGWDIVSDSIKVRVGSYFISGDNLKSLMEGGKHYDVTGILEYQKKVGFIAPRDENDIRAMAECSDVNGKKIAHGAQGCSTADALARCADGTWVEANACYLGCNAEKNECTACSEDAISCNGNTVVNCTKDALPVVGQDCSSSGLLCLAGAGCVECKDNSNCTSSLNGSICNTTSHACVACVENTDCAAPTAVCSANKCVECASDTDCPAKNICKLNTCTAVECKSNSECTDSTKPICDTGSHTCRACNAEEPCPV